MNDAQSLTRALGGKWHGRYGAAACPVCQAQGRRDQNALTLADGHKGLLLDCKKSGCAFRAILAAAGIAPGTFTAPDPMQAAQRMAQERAEAEKRAGQAHRLWQESQPVHGTLAETYFRHRGITCALPDSLRFHPACWHPGARRLPAVVALVEGCERFAVHRTYLRADGRGKAEVDPPKAMLGAVQGGAVRLSGASGPLVVAEGIETGLSLASGLLRTPARVRAALSASGMAGLSLSLPPEPDRLTIATDGDAAGTAAGHTLAERAHALGWAVSLLPAPQGRDWNDILTMKGAAA